VQPLEKVLEDEEDDDNSFDHRDDMSETYLQLMVEVEARGVMRLMMAQQRLRRQRQEGKKLVLHCLPSAR